MRVAPSPVREGVELVLFAILAGALLFLAILAGVAALGGQC